MLPCFSSRLLERREFDAGRLVSVQGLVCRGVKNTYGRLRTKHGFSAGWPHFDPSCFLAKRFVRLCICDSYSVEENLKPTMEWLQTRMDLDQKVDVVAFVMVSCFAVCCCLERGEVTLACGSVFGV